MSDDWSINVFSRSIKDTSGVVRMVIVVDATTWSFILMTTGVIYNRNIFIIQATDDGKNKPSSCQVKQMPNIFIKVQWNGINRKQSTRWQHLSRLKASAFFFSLQKIFSCYKTQQLILGTGIAIWWLTEPHLEKRRLKKRRCNENVYQLLR